MATKIIVDNLPFNIDEQNSWLSACNEDGAIVTFLGKVRSINQVVTSLTLEHYAGMTEIVLNRIVEEARKRWSLNRVVVIHRVGEIQANEAIVFVGVSSAHRKEAFAAAEFIMDILKNEAPFWKKEKTVTGENWVDAKKTDKDTLKKWY
ncbi:molybdopterin synthase catalytic subunit MoaE [Orbaceae bacterium ac157xtp]